MGRHNKYDLLEKLVSAVNDSGWNVAYLEDIKQHPFYLQVYRDNESCRVKIYIWHLTHGGGKARPKDEYRIQITGVDKFEPLQGGKTLILGYWKEADVFAGFDVRKHLGKLGASPSMQIREDALRKAYVNGFEPCDKGNKEVAIAFRPDFFVDYLQSLEPLHDFGQSTKDISVLSEVAQNPEINIANIQIQNVARKTTVVSVSKKLRDASFRKRVLTAYSFHCAVCGVQLKLVEAAHIIPVNHDNGTDETRNGLALCALHHKAYDQALITIAENYSVQISRSRVSELQSQRMSDGLAKFSQDLRPIIILPPAISDRPHAEYIRIANSARGWK
ncbi:MAG: HNH endonuclease [Anaerolineales bacterium]|nr:HNH endonuclease [Anaerolineales bacterium]